MFARFTAYLTLPAEITRFEREYLRKTNRTALGFFALHVPVFALVAWLNDTGPGLALALTTLTVAGPALALRTLGNPRHVSIVHAITAMLLGGLLVHFGRGLWTIEMHFYFFVAIALAAVFANPQVILAAAATVTVHHAALWLVMPESVFNYDAPFTSVAVHAAFVVIESTAACFVARTFFDNVLGLEQIIAARTAALDQKNRDMQLVFDHVGQGFLTVSPDGTLSTEHSRAIGRWIGAPGPSQKVWSYFAAVDPTFGEWLELGWEALVQGALPLDLLLSQLPARFTSRGRVYEVVYTPIGASDGLLVVVTDASERIAREQADAVQRETVTVFQRILSDRSGFLEFFDEVTARVQTLQHEDDPVAAARTVHTIKGNSALFGVTSVVDVCNAVEGRWSADEPSADDLGLVTEAWRAASERVLTFLGDRGTGMIEVEEQEFLAVLHAIVSGTPRGEIAARIAEWRNEPTRRRLSRFGDQAQALASRLGCTPIEVAVTDNQIRLPRDVLVPFWSSLIHVVRNAVDHGLTQCAMGPRRLDLVTERSGSGVVVSVRDNGPGIDWERVRHRAEELGLPADTQQDLLGALFGDGVSTRATATEVSGRGIGLAAVREACGALGAEILVTSDPSIGTRFDFVLPPEILAAA